MLVLMLMLGLAYLALTTLRTCKFCRASPPSCALLALAVVARWSRLTGPSICSLQGRTHRNRCSVQLVGNILRTDHCRSEREGRRDGGRKSNRVGGGGWGMMGGDRDIQTGESHQSAEPERDNKSGIRKQREKEC
eukprot:3074227-Rhodomonas_salina.7